MRNRLILLETEDREGELIPLYAFRLSSIDDIRAKDVSSNRYQISCTLDTKERVTMVVRSAAYRDVLFRVLTSAVVGNDDRNIIGLEVDDYKLASW